MPSPRDSDSFPAAYLALRRRAFTSCACGTGAVLGGERLAVYETVAPSKQLSFIGF